MASNNTDHCWISLSFEQLFVHPSHHCITLADKHTSKPQLNIADLLLVYESKTSRNRYKYTRYSFFFNFTSSKPTQRILYTKYHLETLPLYQNTQKETRPYTILLTQNVVDIPTRTPTLHDLDLSSPQPTMGHADAHLGQDLPSPTTNRAPTRRRGASKYHATADNHTRARDAAPDDQHGLRRPAAAVAEPQLAAQDLCR